MANVKLLSCVPFNEFLTWDVKQFYIRKLTSQYPIELLGSHIIEEKAKVELSLFGEQMVGILGVSNSVGMFDAYELEGRKIKQKYKVVKDGWIAYNPYRVNVGSIGLKTANEKGCFISPAYVVFRCKDTLLSEFMFLLMKSNLFNNVINDSTTGSVRQTLRFDNLANIKIPVPPIKEQKRIVNDYKKLLDEVTALRRAFSQETIDDAIFKRLGIGTITDKSKDCCNLLRTIKFTKMNHWGVGRAGTSVTPDCLFVSTKYENVLLLDGEQCTLNASTSFEDVKGKEISFIPMECVSDLYGNIFNSQVKCSDGKGYTKFQEDDILWAKITPCMQNGKCAIAKGLVNGYGYGSTEFHVFRVNKKKLLPEYLHFFLRTLRLRTLAKEYFTGSSGQQRVSTAFFDTFSIPYLPVVSAKKGELSQTDIVRLVAKLQQEAYNNIEKADELEKCAKRQFEEKVFGGR